MKGSIFKQKNQAEGSWTIVLSLGTDATGKRVRQCYTFKGNKHEAEKRLRELLSEHDKGTLAKPSKLTVAEYLERWLSEYAKSKLTPASYVRYSGLVHGHLIPAFGAVPLVQFKPEHLQSLYTSMLDKGLAARSVRYAHVVIHKALKVAGKWGLVNRNIADMVEVPCARRAEMLTWDADEIGTFLEAAKDTPFYALFLTALYSGMRRSELLALTWRHIDFLYCQISVERGLHRVHGQGYVFTQPKSAKSRRTIAMSPALALALQEHRKHQEHLVSVTEDTLVFCHKDGTPLFPNSVSRAWDLLAKKCGIKPIRFHDARHSHATLLLKQGIHPKIVQERLGHSTISTTLDTYSHVAPGLQEAAAARFDQALAEGYNGRVENVLGQ